MDSHGDFCIKMLRKVFLLLYWRCYQGHSWPSSTNLGSKGDFEHPWRSKAISVDSHDKIKEKITGGKKRWTEAGPSTDNQAQWSTLSLPNDNLLPNPTHLQAVPGHWMYWNLGGKPGKVEYKQIFGVKASRGNTGSGTDTSTGHFAPRVPQAAHQDRAGTFTCPYRHREKEVTDLRKSAN